MVIPSLGLAGLLKSQSYKFALLRWGRCHPHTDGSWAVQSLMLTNAPNFLHDGLG